MRRFTTALLLLTSCHSVDGMSLPPPDGAAAALLVVADVGLSRYEVFAIDRRELTPPVGITVGTRDVVHLFHYEEPLETLRLEPGLQPPAQEGLTRLLPPTERTFAAAAPDRVFEPVDATTLTEMFMTIRVPTPKDEDCGTVGCVALEPARGGGYEPVCRLPCPVEPTAPMIVEPMAPVLTPCPLGWSEVAPAFDGDVTHCAPPPREVCPAGRAQFVNRTGCDDLGDCSLTTPTDLPSGKPIRFVDDSVTNGDGSIGAPFTTIRDALADVAGDLTVALLPGTYTEAIRSSGRSLTIVGTCAGATRIEAPLNPEALNVAGDVTLRRVSIVAEGTTEGIRIQGGTLVLDDVVVSAEDTALRIVGAAARLSRVRIAAGTDRGVVMTEATSSLSATDFVIEDRFGAGIRVTDGGELTLVRTSIAGIDGDDAGHDSHGRAVFAQGAAVTITESAIRGARENGIAVWNGGTLTLTDVFISTEPKPGALPANTGVDIHEGTTAVLDRVNIEGPSTRGLWVFGQANEAQVTASHLRVVGMLEGGVVSFPNSVVDLRQTVIGDVGLAGISGRASQTIVQDVFVRQVRDVEEDENFRYRIAANAAGVRLVGGATLDATALSIRGVDGVGIESGWETGPTAHEDFVWLKSSTIEQAGWGGVHVYRGTARIENVVLRNIGFAAISTYSRPMDVNDVLIDGVREITYQIPDLFAPDPIMKQRSDEVVIEYADRNGSGLTVGGFGNLFNGDLRASRVRVIGADGAGVHIANNSQTKLVDIEVVDSPIGEEVVFGGKVDVERVYFRNVDQPLVEP